VVGSGQHTITLTYNGDLNHLGSDGQTNFTVLPAQDAMKTPL
jgi:hypothetical protein